MAMTTLWARLATFVRQILCRHVYRQFEVDPHGNPYLWFACVKCGHEHHPEVNILEYEQEWNPFAVPPELLEGSTGTVETAREQWKWTLGKSPWSDG